MQVDTEEPHPTEPSNTTNPTGSDSWQEKTPTRLEPAPSNPKTHQREDEDDIFVEVDETENAKILARVMNTDETGPAPDLQLSPHPHDKYTKGPMPPIFDEHPATLLAGLDKLQLQSWLHLPTGKVLARPFDIEVNYQPNQRLIAKALLAAAKEITGATKATVATPIRDREEQRENGAKHPITFLIHDISKRDVETLLRKTVWSSKEITFQVSPIIVKRPEFLFTLEGMTTDNEELALACLRETWSDSAATTFIRQLANRAPNEEEQQNRFGEILDFMESVRVTHLDVRSGGGLEDPHYNVYANGELITHNQTWLELRKYLRGRIYKSNYHGDGKAKREDFICSLCHAHDHPRGLCAFPHLIGWNGGGRNPKKPSPSEQFNTPQNPTYISPRGRGSTRGNHIGKGRGRGNVPFRPTYSSGSPQFRNS